MHILMTADTVGGVWTYAQELVSGLVGRGHRVTLVSLGGPASASGLEWMDGLQGLDYRTTNFRLEWMQNSERDIEASTDLLYQVIDEVQPDLLHFNQYCYGDLATDLPKVVVAHSDVVSWWIGVHGHEPEDNPWIRSYRRTITSGLRGADLVVAPSQWMLGALADAYGKPSVTAVIYNGRNPSQFDPQRQKQDRVVSVGRIWDEAKQVALLGQKTLPIPVWIAGETREPGNDPGDTSLTQSTTINFCGVQSQQQLRDLYAHSSIYAATSCYEPFGLAPLEAALSGCALLMNDLPVFRELWGDSAAYFKTNDADDLQSMITLLTRNTKLRETLAKRALSRALSEFSAARMIEQYESIYEDVSAAQKVA